MQCSSYHCEKIERYIGEYKKCGGCFFKYYCSSKCQTQHWRDVHKKECKKLKKKNKKEMSKK
jgi:hypothetical protein